MRPVFALLTLSLAACAGGWGDYSIPEPSEEDKYWLRQAPFEYPEQICVPASSVDVPAGAEPVDGPDGPELCIWDYFSGSVPEGMEFADVGTCDKVFTQGPSWFVEPERVHRSPSSLLNDEDWVRESEWVQAQVRASGCACCHASSSASGNTSGYDVDAPGVWTDSLTNHRLVMISGVLPMHSLFGHIDPAINHGFDRTQTLFPTTDPERLRAFFTSEFERRGGTDEDTALAQEALDTLFGPVVADTRQCVTEFEGIDADGRVYWNNETPVRQVWLMEEGSDSPGFPPNLDTPPGTLWALYLDPDTEPLMSGDVVIGEVPAGARQHLPAGPAPALEDGKTYKIFATRDFMVLQAINCSLTWSAN